MHARFKIASPKLVEITLTLTADVLAWERLRDDLAKNAGEPGTEFAKKLTHLIEQASAVLATDRWTTGYATGEVEAQS